MNKKEIRDALKPLVRECVRDIIFEEGFLSGIISEVVSGLGARPVITEQVHQATQPQENHDAQIAIQRQKEKLDEARRRMADAIGRDAYGGANLFEGTEPLQSAGTPGSSPAPSNPLSGYGAKDEGVNIDSLLGGVGKNWKKLI